MLNQLRGVYSSLQKYNVRYVTIGGVAAILHGVPRTTFDLDILIEATLENAQHLLDALLDADRRPYRPPRRAAPLCRSSASA